MSPSRGSILQRTLLYVAAVLLALWVLVPIYFITLAAFSSQEAVYRYPKNLVPQDMSTETMRFFLDSDGVVESLERSVMVAALTLAIALGVGTPAGYAIARFGFRGADTFRLAIVSTRAFPIVILSIPLAVTYIRWGIDDSVLGTSLAHTALALPFAVLVTSSVFAGISVELEEAAMTLGCSRMKAFLRIALPLALPGVATTAILCLVFSWNDYAFAVTFSGPESQTLPIAASQLVTQTSIDWGQLTAIGTIVVAPMILVGLIVRRWLVTGLTLGAVTGE
jgi:multiple sugar transport system permease protein